MKNIVLVQPNFRQGPKSINAHYLPYSVGVLWAYAIEVPSIREEYSLQEIIWRREPVDQVFERIKHCEIFAFSTYVWNRNYNYKLAKILKEYNPRCTTIFGGPEIEIENPQIFEKNPFMDYVIKTEGEQSFAKLLDDFENVDHIPGILVNRDLQVFDTGTAVRIQNLDDIPSPYINGVFDDLIKDNPNVEWNATLETNRGCPYMCTFCDWGSLTYSKVKKFDLERVFSEIDWIGRNKCGFVTVADANFGIFPERDNLITDKILDVQNKQGYPYTFAMTWAKNQKQSVVDIVKKLTDSSNFNQGLTVSVQSMDLDVLENIKRKNLEQHKIEEIFKLCEEKNIPTYTEIILGLPGETLESWKNNFWELFEAGAHTGLNIFQAQLLENAELNLTQSKEYDISYITVYDYMAGSYNEDPIKEGVKVVTGTNTLPYNDMLEAQVFNWFINTFHIYGITTYISRFLRSYMGVSYKDFYESLFDYIKSDEWLETQKEEIRYYYNKWMTEGVIGHPDLQNVEIHGWNLMHRTLILMHTEKQLSEIFKTVENFIDRYFDDKELKKQILDFQKNYFISYDTIKNYPLVEYYDYDFINYLRGGNLYNHTSIKFEFLENKEMSEAEFFENIYFRRRRNFGKAHITILHEDNNEH